MSDTRDQIGLVTDAPDHPDAAWRTLSRAHPALLGGLSLIAAVLIAMSVWVVRERDRYTAEIERLRASMTDLERERTDAIVSHEGNKLQLAIALLRRQAQVEKTLHLSVSIDTGAMYLERDGALLREMPVQVGPERRVGVAPDTVRVAPPRGVRTISRVLDDSSAWEVPSWVYTDRGVPVDSVRVVRGALGPIAIMLDGGAVIYSTPQGGPLGDSLYLLPGAIRARAEDLRAILPNLTPGMRVYFY